MTLTPREKMRIVMKQIRKRGFRIKSDKRLHETPYRASHPLVEKMVGVKNKGKVFSYDPYHVNTEKKKAMDINHENIEHYMMSKYKWSYRKAHLFANRHQFDFNFMENKK